MDLAGPGRQLDATRARARSRARVALEVLAVAVVLAAGLWLRARSLGERGLWLDEFDTVRIARGGPLDVWRQARAISVGPIFYELVAASSALLGETEVAVRLPAVVLGTLGPLCFGLALASALGRRAGVAAFLLLAIHHELVWHGQEARSYALGEASLGLAVLALGRAVETGRARDRLLLWVAGLLAVDAHATFAPVLPAIALAPLAIPSRERAYTARLLVRDALLAAVTLVPVASAALGYSRKRSVEAWAAAPLPDVLAQICPPEVAAVLGLCVALAVGRWLVERRSAHARPTRPRPSRPRPAPRRGRRAVLAFLALLLAATAAELAALSLVGSNLGVLRYLVPALEATLGLTAFALACQPAPIAALALVVLGVCEARLEPGNKGMEWREAQEQLRALAPGASDPVLLWTGYGAADDVVEPGRISPVARSVLESPLEIAPGQPPPGRRIFLLTRRWNVPGQPRYFEAELVPLLERSPRFFVVAHPGYAEALESWLAARLPDRFQRTFRSRVFTADVVVERFEVPPGR